jgi:hypothetical protein
VLIVLSVRNRRGVRVAEWLWMAVGIVLLFRLGRFAPIFALIAAPVLAATLPALPDLVLTRRAVHVGAAAALSVTLVLVVILMPGRHTPMATWLNRNGAAAFGYPCAAADFVEQRVQPVTGQLMNEFTWGGYLSWRLGDRFRVFLDGRTQLYTAQFWQTSYLSDGATRAKTLSCVRADAAVLPVRDSVFRTALVQLGWTSAYRDEHAEVVLPPQATSWHECESAAKP